MQHGTAGHGGGKSSRAQQGKGEKEAGWSRAQLGREEEEPCRAQQGRVAKQMGAAQQSSEECEAARSSCGLQQGRE